MIKNTKPDLAPCKGIQDSLWILDSRYWILAFVSGTGFQSLVGSGFLKLCSRFQSPGFQIPREKFPAFRMPLAEISWIPGSGIRIPLQGATDRP